MKHYPFHFYKENMKVMRIIFISFHRGVVFRVFFPPENSLLGFNRNIDTSAAGLFPSLQFNHI